MPHDRRVDAYIARAAPFAQPILTHLRALAHRAAPDLDEAIKWGMPMFLHGGRIVANIAAFKAHASLGTWQREPGDTADKPDGMGQDGKLANLGDLPPDEEIIAHIRRAIANLDAGVTVRRKTTAKPPPDLRAALDALPAATAGYDALPPSQRREYCEWVGDAKQAATRARRIAQSVAWCAEGRRRNWKRETARHAKP